MKQKNLKKLKEWVKQAIKKGFDPNDIQLYINEDYMKPQEPQTA